MPKKKAKPPLSKTHPKLAKEAYGWDPTQVFAHIGTGRKLRWICIENHQYEATLGNRVQQKSGCPYCSGHKVLPGFNDLATTHPKLAQTADGWDPKKVSAGSHKKVNWVCIKGHSFSAIVKSRIRNIDGGCPFCDNKKVLPGFNDLATTHQLIAKEADGWDSRTVVSGSNRKFKWRCELGHNWLETPNKRVGRGDSCPICSSHKLLSGFNDLATTHPHIASEVDGWDPKTIFAGSNKKFQWKCQIGHFYESSPNARTGINKTGCPICSNQKLLVGFNDLASTHPEMAKEAFEWDPKTVVAGTHSKLRWKCNLGHIWKARGVDRKKTKGCPYCSGVQVLTGFNDLKTLYPDIAKEAYGWNSEKVLPGSGKNVTWKCASGHKWRTDVFHRTGKERTGCPGCSKTGFNPNLEGYLYFLNHDDWQMLQVGITNIPENRINRHKSNGWEVIEIRGPMDGLLTQQWETAILRMLKAKRADLSNSKIAGKFDGYSEAWSKSTFPVKSIKELMRLTEEFEEKK